MSSSKAAWLLLLLLFSHCVTSLIVPEELPTILSLVYSNIPPVKKGTDSRLGVGFRLGEHADFQVLVELGPQIYTEKIGLDKDNTRKRAAMMVAAMRGDYGPWTQAVAKYQVEQKVKRMLEKYGKSEKPAKLKENVVKKADKVEKANENDWLQKWSQGAKDDESASAVVEEEQKSLPVLVNRMRVVNSHQATSGDSQRKDDDDLVILKRLFGANDQASKNNENKSVE